MMNAMDDRLTDAGAEERRCKDCRDWFALTPDNFVREKKSRGGFAIRCRPCHTALKAERRAAQLARMTDAEREIYASRMRQARKRYDKAHPESKLRSQLIQKLPKYLRQFNELSWLLALTEELGYGDRVYALGITAMKVRDRLSYATGQKNLPSRIPTRHCGLLYRHQWLAEKIATATPDMVRRALQNELRREAGLVDPYAGFSWSEREELKAAEQSLMPRVRKHMVERAKETPTPEFLANLEATLAVDIDASSVEAVLRADRHLAAAISGGEAHHVRRAESKARDADDRFTFAMQEQFDDLYGSALRKWQAKADAGEIGTFAEEFPEVYGEEALSSPAETSEALELIKAEQRQLKKRELICQYSEKSILQESGADASRYQLLAVVEETALQLLAAAKERAAGVPAGRHRPTSPPSLGALPARARG